MPTSALKFHHKTPIINSSGSTSGLSREIFSLLKKIGSSSLPTDLKVSVEDTLEHLARAMKHSLYQTEYEQITKYVEVLLDLPWDNRSQDNLDLEKSKQILDRNHFGLEKIKERILEYISVLRLQSDRDKTQIVKFSRSPVLCFVGLPGTGKTSLAASIAETMGRQFIRIPMGGMVSPFILRGQPKTYPEAEPGAIIKGIRKFKTKNPVILLDEIDSVAQGAESDLMGVLLELLDPEQNHSFNDYYVDYPFDLSEVLFVCSANKVGGLTEAVADRLEVIIMTRYTDEDKISIAKDYLLSKELQNIPLPEGSVKFSDDAWPHIIKPFGYDIDIRSLQRTINGILRKVAKKHVEGVSKHVDITAATLPEYLPDFV